MKVQKFGWPQYLLIGLTCVFIVGLAAVMTYKPVPPADQSRVSYDLNQLKKADKELTVERVKAQRESLSIDLYGQMLALEKKINQGLEMVYDGRIQSKDAYNTVKADLIDMLGSDVASKMLSGVTDSFSEDSGADNFVASKWIKSQTAFSGYDYAKDVMQGVSAFEFLNREGESMTGVLTFVYHPIANTCDQAYLTFAEGVN